MKKDTIITVIPIGKHINRNVKPRRIQKTNMKKDNMHTLLVDIKKKYKPIGYTRDLERDVVKKDFRQYSELIEGQKGKNTKQLLSKLVGDINLLQNKIDSMLKKVELSSGDAKKVENIEDKKSVLDRLLSDLMGKVITYRAKDRYSADDLREVERLVNMFGKLEQDTQQLGVSIDLLKGTPKDKGEEALQAVKRLESGQVGEKVEQLGRQLQDPLVVKKIQETVEPLMKEYDKTYRELVNKVRKFDDELSKDPVLTKVAKRSKMTMWKQILGQVLVDLNSQHREIQKVMHGIKQNPTVDEIKKFFQYGEELDKIDGRFKELEIQTGAKKTKTYSKQLYPSLELYEKTLQPLIDRAVALIKKTDVYRKDITNKKKQRKITNDIPTTQGGIPMKAKPTIFRYFETLKNEMELKAENYFKLEKFYESNILGATEPDLKDVALFVKMISNVQPDPQKFKNGLDWMNQQVEHYYKQV